jgi:hypothetical protein
VWDRLELVGLGWSDDQSPVRWKKTGPNPTDRGKAGVKRSLLTEGHGVPIGLTIEGAQRHDMKLVRSTIESIVVDRPELTEEQLQGMCLDKGYVCWLLGISVRKKHKRCGFNCSSEVYFLWPPRGIRFAFHVIAASRCIFLKSPFSKISADSRPFSNFMVDFSKSR